MYHRTPSSRSTLCHRDSFQLDRPKRKLKFVFALRPSIMFTLLCVVAQHLALPAALYSDEPPALPRKADFHLYLLLGQSNMAGRGTLEEQDRTPHSRVFMLSKEGQWVKAVDPLHFDKLAAGVGLGKTFGQILADANPEVTIGLIPCAVGGSPIDAWRPGEFYAPTNSHPWDDAMLRATIALQAGELKGILWHQGESDAKPGLAEAYASKLDDLISRLRKQLNAPNLPFIAGQMGRFEDQPWDDAHMLVDSSHRELPQRVEQTAFVVANGLKHKGDKVHFDAASYRELGKRYATAYLQLTQSAAQKSAFPTNIVLMYADNLGYGDLGCYGNREIQSPRIDQLAKEGVRCTDFYVVTATCTPSRGAILTGRHPRRNGLMHQLATTENWTGIGLPHRERLIPQYLKDANYATACFGKWNIGFAAGSRPTERGFDEFLGCRSGNIHYFKHTYQGEYDIFKGTERFPVEGYSTDIFADTACDFIKRQATLGKPYFVYLPFNAPHYVSTVNTMPDENEKPVWHVPSKYLERYGWPADDQTEKHRYLALLTAMDDAVGRVLDTLDATGQRDNTLVMFISDMGAILRPTHGKDVASNMPFRAGAPELYEGGIRVPAIFRWPGKITPSTECDAVLTHLDILPLCLLAAGQQAPSDRVLDGRDPLPALTGGGSPHARIVATIRTAAALREGQLKIHRTAPDMPWELFDLIADPGETNNLSASRPADLKRLTATFKKWEQDITLDASEPSPQPPKNTSTSEKG